MKTRETTRAEYLAECERRFGPDHSKWAFVCPACGHVQTVQDYENAGAPEGAIAFSCVGRWIKGCRDAFGGKGNGPCNYTGGGFFRLNPVKIGESSYFEIAAAPSAPQPPTEKGE